MAPLPRPCPGAKDMIAICWKCLYIYEIRGRYVEYRDKKGVTHKTYKECPRCRSTKVIVRKSFNLSEMKTFQKRILKGEEEPGPLQTISAPSSKKEKKPSKSKRKSGGQKKELRPGTIENFHQKYREAKKDHYFDSKWEPTPAMVSEWLRDGKTSKKVRDRWALELLEKHKPKD